MSVSWRLLLCLRMPLEATVSQNPLLRDEYNVKLYNGTELKRTTAEAKASESQPSESNDHPTAGKKKRRLSRRQFQGLEEKAGVKWGLEGIGDEVESSERDDCAKSEIEWKRNSAKRMRS